jgi:hypothetical protein
MPLYPLPGEKIPIETGPNGEPIIPIDDLTPPLSPDTPIIPPKKTPGRLLFDKFNAGETQFTSLRYTDARDGFNKQMNLKNPYQFFPPTGYIGIAPNEKQSADWHGIRISDFLATPRGQKFINKQVGLQLSNTRIESLDLFSTTLNTITKKAGFGSLGDGLGGIANISITPSTVLSAITTIKDIQNNGFNERNILSSIGIIARKQTRSAISPLQNYNFQNTIDQAGTDPNTGWNHFDRFGASNIMSDNDKYWYVVRRNNGSEDIFPTDSPSNRLVKLRTDLGTGTASTDIISELADKITNGRFGLKAIRNFTNDVNSYYNQGLGLFNSFGNNNSSRDFQPINNAISDIFNFANNKLAIADQFIAPLTNNVIDQYEGGPNSLNGVGPTIIKRYDNTNDWSRLDKINNIRDYNLNKLRNLLFGEGGFTNFGPTVISQQYQQDTGEELFKNINRVVSNTVYKHGKKPNYNTVRQTNIPKPRKSYRGYTTDDKLKKYDYETENQKIEKININRNATDYKYFNKNGQFTEFNRYRPNPKNTDEVKTYNQGIHRVVFTPINPFTGTPFGVIPEIDGRIRFDAYISNFKDNFIPTWNDINYVGRSEVFHTFSRFKREVSFTLQVPCFNPIQLRNRHRGLYELASINAGSYSDGTSGSKLGGVITYLRLGNYLNSQGNYEGEPGIITNFSITIPNDASWDTDEQLAHYLTVDIGFKLIHNSRPARTSGGFIGANIGEYFLGFDEDINERGKRNDDLGKNILKQATGISGDDAANQISNEEEFQRLAQNQALGQSIGRQYTNMSGEDAVNQYNDEQKFQRQAQNQALGNSIRNSISNPSEEDLLEQSNNVRYPISDDWRGEFVPDPPSLYLDDNGGYF